MAGTVSSYGIEFGDDFLLFDPPSVPDELRERATAVILTRALPGARRPSARPAGADAARRHVGGLGREAWRRPNRVRGMESEDLAWLRAGEGGENNDLILWLPAINAIVTGDSLSDFGDGLDIQLGNRKHVTRDDVVERLRPLLDLPTRRIRAARARRADGSRTARARAFLTHRRRADEGDSAQATRVGHSQFGNGPDGSANDDLCASAKSLEGSATCTASEGAPI